LHAKFKKKKKINWREKRGKTAILPWVGDHPSEVLLG
jgi:hypothetical protein